MLKSRNTRIQLKDTVIGDSIQSLGGVVSICKLGSPDLVELFDIEGLPAANPSEITNGLIEFYTSDTVLSFDMYLLAPGGQFATILDVPSGGPNEISIDTNSRNQTMVIPFSHEDSTAAIEQDTGFVEPVGCIFTGIGTAIRVVDINSGKTIDIGTDSGDSGDSDGFVAAASVAATGIVINSGALIAGYIPHIGAGKSITYTTSSGTDSVSGFAILPYILTA